MGKGKGGRGKGGSGKGKGDDRRSKGDDGRGDDEKGSSPRRHQKGDDGNGGWGDWGGYGDQSGWNKDQQQSQSRTEPADQNQEFQWNQQWSDSSVMRQSAAQWRFVCRVLQRHAPEERVHDERRQLVLGDHVLVQHSWDFVERHAIICSANDDGYGRRSGRDDPYWVVHWSQDAGRLQCVSLSQFAKGDALFRVQYPHWACQCHVPSCTTMKPHIAAEHYLEEERPDLVAKRANGAVKSGWTPNWSQSQDLEFCIQTKTGANPPFEMHGRQTLASAVQWPFGIAIGGERKPSSLFGVGKSSGTGGSSNAFSSGFSPPGTPSSKQQSSPPPAAPPVISMDPYASQGYAAGMWTVEQNWQGWNPQSMQAPMPGGAPGGIANSLQSNKQLSAAAMEFVPGGAGLYQ